jgi:hypothetical protein
MIELTPDRIPLALQAFFERDLPDAPRAFAVLDGIAAGQILTDDATRPTWGAVREATYGTLYLGGALDAARVQRLVDRLRQSGDVLICPWPDDPLVQLLPNGAVYDGRAIYFADRDQTVDLAPYIGQLPPDCQLRRADRALFARSLDRETAIAELGSIDAVLAKTLRVFLMRGEDILCEAATGPATRGRMEMGVTTLEGHRRYGYATIACAQLIALCEEAGYATWWDCAEQNTASAALARKLGYGNGRPYRVLMWSGER